MKLSSKKCPSCKERLSAKEFDNHVYGHIREGKLVGIETWTPNEGSRWQYRAIDTPMQMEKARQIFQWEVSRRKPEGTVVRLVDATKIKILEARSRRHRATK